MVRLHDLFDDADEVVPQDVEVDRIAEASREGFDRLGRVVLTTVEAPVDESLDAVPKWKEKGRYSEGGSGYREVRLSGQGIQKRLQSRHRDDVGPGKERGESSIDQGRVTRRSISYSRSAGRRSPPPTGSGGMRSSGPSPSLRRLNTIATPYSTATSPNTAHAGWTGKRFTRSCRADPLHQRSHLLVRRSRCS